MRIVIISDFAPLPRLDCAKRSRFPDELREPRPTQQNMNREEMAAAGENLAGRGQGPSFVQRVRSRPEIRSATTTSRGASAARQSSPRLPPHRPVCLRSRPGSLGHTSAPAVAGSSCRSRLHRPDVYSGVLLRLPERRCGISPLRSCGQMN
jgi:hypothetical protein